MNIITLKEQIDKNTVSIMLFLYSKLQVWVVFFLYVPLLHSLFSKLDSLPYTPLMTCMKCTKNSGEYIHISLELLRFKMC